MRVPSFVAFAGARSRRWSAATLLAALSWSGTTTAADPAAPVVIDPLGLEETSWDVTETVVRSGCGGQVGMTLPSHWSIVPPSPVQVGPYTIRLDGSQFTRTMSYVRLLNDGLWLIADTASSVPLKWVAEEQRFVQLMMTDEWYLAKVDGELRGRHTHVEYMTKPGNISMFPDGRVVQHYELCIDEFAVVGVPSAVPCQH